MFILSSEQQQLWDNYTIKHEPIKSIDLMERASKRWIEHARPYLTNKSILMLTGPGNNGGDGLAIARRLQNEGFEVCVLLFRFKKQLSEDCNTNLNRLPKSIEVVQIDDLSNFKKFESPKLELTLIDALFGTGIKNGLSDPFSGVVDTINKWKLPVLSIDLPSGLVADKPNNSDDSIIKAQVTFTFQAPKLSFFLPDHQHHLGDWKTIDIGLTREFLRSATTAHTQLSAELISNILPERNPISHKGNYGHLLVVAGTSYTLGASLLAAHAGFTSGCGWTSLIVDALDNFKTINQAHSEMMLAELPVLQSLNEKHRICIGPGLGTGTGAKQKLQDVLRAQSFPMVLDADALNLIAANPDLLKDVPKQSILTPHPGELARLIGHFENGLEQLKAARNFAQEHTVVLLIKRPNTAIINPYGKIYFNSTGNAGLAKAGSGDVLAGMIASFLTQGATSTDAACLGVYLHGKAADLAIASHSLHGLTPSILIDHIGKAILTLPSF